MQKVFPSKLLFFLLALLVVIVLPVIFTPAGAEIGRGQVLGAFTVSGQQKDIDLSFIGPLIIGPRIVRADQENSTAVIKVADATLNLSAKAALVFDAKSSAVIYSLNPQKELPIASLTKLMTAVVAMEQPNFDRPLTVSGADILTTAPLLNLHSGDEVMPLDLVKAMLVGSANDAAWALANHFPNRAVFVALMNQKAKQLGMEHTAFSNPVGFDDKNNFSTASDLQKLLNYALPKLPYEELWKKNNYAFESNLGNGYYIRNSNDLIFGHENIKSIKTGYTPGAMESMIVQGTSGDKKIIAMVLGAADRNSAMLELVDYVFKSYAW